MEKFHPHNGVKGGFMEKVTIKNISSANIILSFADLKFRRELVPGRALTVDKDMYEEMLFDPGFNGMVNEHYLYIEGIEESAEDSKILDRAAIAKIFDDMDITSFAKMIPNAAPAEKETIVQLAIEKKITNNAIVNLIKKYCDVDVISAIHMQHQAEET